MDKKIIVLRTNASTSKFTLIFPRSVGEIDILHVDTIRQVNLFCFARDYSMNTLSNAELISDDLKLYSRGTTVDSALELPGRWTDCCLIMTVYAKATKRVNQHSG